MKSSKATKQAPYLWEEGPEIAQRTAKKPLLSGYTQAAAINGGFEQ